MSKEDSTTDRKAGEIFSITSLTCLMRWPVLVGMPSAHATSHLDRYIWTPLGWTARKLIPISLPKLAHIETSTCLVVRTTHESLTIVSATNRSCCHVGTCRYSFLQAFFTISFSKLAQATVSTHQPRTSYIISRLYPDPPFFFVLFNINTLLFKPDQPRTFTHCYSSLINVEHSHIAT